jgi:kexin
MASTTAVDPAPTKTSILVNPTDHPDRPTKPTAPVQEEETLVPTAAPAAATSSPSTWIPSFLPTFGVGHKAQVWILGAVGLILAFCIGLGTYFFLARRKRLRNNPRDEWEFDLLEEDEADGLNGTGKATRGGKGGKRRAGELYDAFAAGSEDELSDEEFVDEAGREKGLYADDGEGSEGSGSGGLRSPSHHVIGELDSEDEDEEVIGEKGGKR